METKVCSICGLEKPLSEYHKVGYKSDGTQRFRNCCKVCANKREAERYREKKDFINSKKNKCYKCGDTRQYVLEFHHKDPSQKEFNIGQLKIKDYKRLENEIDKCIVLCANCHKEFHYLYLIQGITLEDYLLGTDVSGNMYDSES